MYGAVTQPSKGVGLNLYLNGNVASVVFVSGNTDTAIYREGAHMAPLASGTTVSIRVVSAGYAAGTGILGFLLYPQ